MRSSRSSHVRLKIVALLASMAALWAFAAYVTVREGMNLLFVNTVGEFGVTTSEVVGALQAERRLSAEALSGSRSTVDSDLEESRQRTDLMVSGWRDEAHSGSLRFAADGQLETRIALADAALARLAEHRTGVDRANLDRDGAVTAYTEIINLNFDIFAAMSGLDDQEIARQSRALVAMAQVRELLSQEDALLAGVLGSGDVRAADIGTFSQLVGAQRFLYDSRSVELAPEDLALYDQIAAGPEMSELRRLENEFISEAQPGAPPPFDLDEWERAVEPAATALRDGELVATDNVVARATPVGIGVIVRLLLAGGLGLLAVIAAAVVSITTARSLVRQLERLRDAARDLASNRLPRVVERLSTGERVDVAAEAPPLRFGDDEIGQVGQAFNAVQETAVRAAVQQAELRHGVRDVFLSLARRTQNLVHKQLSVVDGMERRETDADEMEELYRIDHLATRMRRNAENLIVLAGSTPGRVWRRPVAMVDVVRGAIAEVEDYQRVNLMPVQGGALEGRVAGDVIHLLAELIENAASFSPPYAKVSVAGQRVAHGFVVEIEDRGLGMTDADLATVNRKLAEPPDFSLADASRLGHYVVAKLAQRHGIRVHLRTSPYGGVTAIVLVPKEIMLDTPDDEPVAVSAVPAPPPAPANPSDGAQTPRLGGPEGHRGNGSGTTDRNAAVAVVRQARPIENLPAMPPAELVRPPGVSRPPEVAQQPPAADKPDGLPVRPKPEGPARTPSGLPWRVRQASLPRQLLNEDDLGDEPTDRDPEQVRRAMRSFQLGTQRGRSDAGEDVENRQEGER
jgi:methyl-accepting chemotaxis protein